ncbi:uncharacterized protein N7459_005463 [Penicillium hispanicum]|uniref:uncharacterized protein n=1 Tax=Penicillium hispanicum TaxID=1080232 RepID=UPI0025409EF2|nr:uncharacterized protein N7459_005463 [Penicillium hispanicum]KAJ5579478.1 hypothetical protein N7459_005463 [Penicillium hispanicum]
MRFLSLKTILPYLVIISIPGIWAFPTGNVTLIDTEPSTDIDPHSLQPRAMSRLGQILARSYNAGKMVNSNADQNNQIRYYAGKFETTPWEISWWNPLKDLIISFATAKGAGFVMIPQILLHDCFGESGRGVFDKEIYRRTIYEPVFGSNGYLPELIKTWTRNGKQDPRDWWFPDGLLFVISSQHTSKSIGGNYKDIAMYAIAVNRIRDDLLTLWTTDPQGRPLDNILGDPDRFDWSTLSYSPVTNTPFSSRPRKPQLGVAITWDPSTPKYEIWLGAEDTARPVFTDSPAVTGFAFQQWGYYPYPTYPLSMPEGKAGPTYPGPGGGCKDVCDTN